VSCNSLRNILLRVVVIVILGLHPGFPSAAETPNQEVSWEDMKDLFGWYQVLTWSPAGEVIDQVATRTYLTLNKKYKIYKAREVARFCLTQTTELQTKIFSAQSSLNDRYPIEREHIVEKMLAAARKPNLKKVRALRAQIAAMDSEYNNLNTAYDKALNTTSGILERYDQMQRELNAGRPPADINDWYRSLCRDKLDGISELTPSPPKAAPSELPEPVKDAGSVITLGSHLVIPSGTPSEKVSKPQTDQPLKSLYNVSYRGIRPWPNLSKGTFDVVIRRDGKGGAAITFGTTEPDPVMVTSACQLGDKVSFKTSKGKPGTLRYTTYKVTLEFLPGDKLKGHYQRLEPKARFKSHRDTEVIFHTNIDELDKWVKQNVSGGN